MGRYRSCAINLDLVVTALMVLLAITVRGQEESSSQCIPYGGPCTNGSERCCFNPMVTCLANRREEMSCLSPLDLTNISPSLSSSPLYSTLSNASRQILNLIPGLTPPSS